MESVVGARLFRRALVVILGLAAAALVSLGLHSAAQVERDGARSAMSFAVQAALRATALRRDRQESTLPL